MRLETSIATPIANALRAIALTNNSGILGIIGDSSVQIGGAEVSPHKLLSFLREITIIDFIQGISIVDVHVKKGAYSRQTITSQLGITVENVDSTAIGIATSDFSIKVILGQHTSFSPITRDKVVAEVGKAGYSVDKAVLIPFPILSNKTVRFNTKDLGDGFTEIRFDEVEETALIDLAKRILEGCQDR